MPARPFQFYSTATLAKYTGQYADSSRSLLRALQRVSPSSLFYHLHYALFVRHFTTSEFMNDFARWVHFTLREERLAERLSAVDPLQFDSLSEARNRLVGLVAEHLGAVEHVPHVPSNQRFYFLEGQTFVFPLGEQAQGLAEFREKVKRIPLESVFYHVIAAPLRIGKRENDFSLWIEHELHEPEAAQRVRGLSPYVTDLFELRGTIAAALGGR